MLLNMILTQKLQLHTAMSTTLSYNTVRDEIVKILTNRSNLNKYIINTDSTRPADRIFSRNSKFPLENMLAFMIMPRAESTAVEFAAFAEATGTEPIRKQTFFMKRRQLKDTLFDAINREYLSDMYLEATGLRTWHGLFLIACDGTTVKLPDTGDINDTYGKVRTDKREYGCPQIRMEVLRDVLNGPVFGVETESISCTEHKLALQAIGSLPGHIVDNSVFIFDRGNIGAAFFLRLQSSDIQYVIRLPRNFNKEVDSFFSSSEETADVLVEMSKANWHTKGKDSFRNLGLNPGNCPPVMLHLVKCRLSSGDTEVLAVRINGYHLSGAEAYDLYGLRWSVETSIDELKNQLQLEVFSGNTVLAVLQDIKAKVIAYNMGIRIAREATRSIGGSDVAMPGENPDGKSNRRIKVNLNIGWFYIKKMIARALLSPPDQTPGILTQALTDLKLNVEEYELGRHLPHETGSGYPLGKYITYTNYKRAI